MQVRALPSPANPTRVVQMHHPHPCRVMRPPAKQQNEQERDSAPAGHLRTAGALAWLCHALPCLATPCLATPRLDVPCLAMP